MSHPEFDLLSAYLDDEAAPEERARVETHLPTCSQCSETLEALRITVADMRADPEPVPTEQQAWALRSAVAAARRRDTARGRWSVGIAGAAAAVVAVVAVSLGSLGGDPVPSEDTSFGPAALGAAENQMQPLIADSRDFDANSAGILLTEYGSTPGKQFADEPPIEDDDSAPRLSIAAGSESVSECARQVLEGTTEPTHAVSYIAATWEGRPAYFLIYRVEAQEPRLELWVVDQDDCRVRHWAQRPA